MAGRSGGKQEIVVGGAAAPKLPAVRKGRAVTVKAELKPKLKAAPKAKLIPAAKPRLRHRHDGFTPGRQRTFLEALRETGCIQDACRKARISKTTAYNARDRLPELARKWNVALAMAGTPIDMIAFERATIGAEKTVIREGKVVQTERKPSDTILRTLMLNGQRGREATASAAEREKIRAEVRRELELEEKRNSVATHEELVEALTKRIAAVKRRYERGAAEVEGAEGDRPEPAA